MSKSWCRVALRLRLSNPNGGKDADVPCADRRAERLDADFL